MFEYFPERRFHWQRKSGELLKAIYKASQEKKERTRPRVPKVFVFEPNSTQQCVSETSWLV